MNDTTASANRGQLNQVTIIGLGLMGGSLALALRRAGVVTRIIGCGREVLQQRAMEMSAIDAGCANAADSVADSDFVFLCTPVETSIKLMAQIARRLKPGAVISDVGSTKASFASAAREIFGKQAYERVLPGHPLAGRELSGLEHASVDLYAGCVWVLTPLEDGAEETPSHRRLREALEMLGAHVVFNTPQEHDRTLAYTSHLPQMLSTALSLTLQRAFGNPGNPSLRIHAGGLRSMLRLAESEPAMWEQIAASNQQNIAAALEAMEAELRKLRESLGDAEFRKKFEAAREFAKFLKG